MLCKPKINNYSAGYHAGWVQKKMLAHFWRCARRLFEPRASRTPICWKQTFRHFTCKTVSNHIQRILRPYLRYFKDTTRSIFDPTTNQEPQHTTTPAKVTMAVLGHGSNVSKFVVCSNDLSCCPGRYRPPYGPGWPDIQGPPPGEI